MQAGILEPLTHPEIIDGRQTTQDSTMHRSSLLFVLRLVTVAVVLNTFGVFQLSADDKNADRIKPYAKNPRYWQYNIVKQ